MGTYIHNLAATLIRELGITKEDLGQHDSTLIYGDEDRDYEEHDPAQEISKKLKRMRPETLGKIAAYGLNDFAAEKRYKRSLLDVYPQNPFGPDFSFDQTGKELLVRLARAAVVAEIVDILNPLTAETSVSSEEGEVIDPLSEVSDRDMHRAGL